MESPGKTGLAIPDDSEHLARVMRKRHVDLNTAVEETCIRAISFEIDRTALFYS